METEYNPEAEVIKLKGKYKLKFDDKNYEIIREADTFNLLYSKLQDFIKENISGTHILDINGAVFNVHRPLDTLEVEEVDNTEEAQFEELVTGKKEKKNYTSCIVDEENKIMVEQVWDEKQNSRFCIYSASDDKIEYALTYEHNGIIYHPNEGEELIKRAVILPSKAEEYGSDEKLDEQIKTFVNKWVDVPEKISKFGLWQTKRSWVYDKFHTINYARVQGDTGVGKSRYLDTFGYIHYKPIFTTGATTPAPLFRIIDKWRGTLVMDEADLRRSDESDDIIKILNNGFEKGKHIMRCDQNDANKLDFFDPFCPKILATRKSFSDKATESRCITHVAEVTSRNDIPLNLNKDFFSESEEVRNKLLMWRFKNYFKIDMSAEFDLGDIEPRVKQIVSSFIYLFSNDEKAMDSFKEYITEYQSELIEERKSSFEGSIVIAIHDLLERGVRDITASKIITEGEFTGKNGKPMAPRSLSSALKSLAFKKSESRRVGSKIERCLPLNQEHLDRIFKRYGCYGVTVVTVVTGPSDINNMTNLDRFESKTDISGDDRIQRNNRNTVTDNTINNISKDNRNNRNTISTNVVEIPQNTSIIPIIPEKDTIPSKSHGDPKYDNQKPKIEVVKI